MTLYQTLYRILRLIIHKYKVILYVIHIKSSAIWFLVVNITLDQY
jgi:hypothetical protein